MIFLYKILFGQLTFLIMMAMYRLFPVDEHFNDGAVWYLISGFLCLGIFVIWRRPSFFRTQIFPVHSHMSPGKFLSFFGIFMIAQNASSVLYVLMEMGAQHFGFTFARSLEAATGGSVTISMLLYSGFAAPLIEEFIFRGAVLKTLEPFGKWFALLASSLAFALMHGNFAQIPFAMAAGLIDRLPFLHCVFYAHSFADRILTHCIDRLNFFHSCTGQFISAHCDQCCDPCKHWNNTE